MDQEGRPVAMRKKYKLIKVFLVFVFSWLVFSTLRLVLSSSGSDNQDVSIDTSLVQEIERLANLHSEILSMPECPERILLCLIHSTSTKCLNASQVPNDVSIPLPKEDSEIELELLNQALTRENLESSKTKEILFGIKTKIRNANWEGTRNDLEILLKEIRPLNMKETCLRGHRQIPVSGLDR